MNRFSAAVLTASVLASGASLPAQAYDLLSNGIYYNYASGRKSVYATYEQLGQGAYSGDITIPAEVRVFFEAFPVRGVGDHAFFNSQTVTSVTMEDGPVYIEDQAFSHCYAMKILRLPATIQRIEDFAFEYCDDLQTVRLPASLTQLGYGVFSNCLGMRSFEVDSASTTLESADGILYTKGRELMVQYPAGRPDQEFTIPAEVKQVTDYAFCPAPSLRTVAIGPGLQKVQPLTFADCAALTAIVVDSANAEMTAVDGVLYSAGMTELIQLPCGRRDASFAVPSPVATIGDMSMTGAVALKELDLPATLTAIGDYALAASQALSDITVRAAVPPTVGMMAFADNVPLTATLRVDEESLAAYRAHEFWGKFRRIVALESAAAADPAADPAADATTFTVDGREISCTQPDTEFTVTDLAGRVAARGKGTVAVSHPGVYIVSSGARVAKVTVR